MTTPRRVFLIDDDADDALIFHETLKEIDLPIECLHYSDCQLVLHTLRETSISVPDFIFLDLNMPRMNGTTVLAEIRKLPAFHHVPVIIYSTSASPHDIEATKQLGATYFFTKPNGINALKEKLLKIFGMEW